tara:strand:- start:883 stop:1284 length:402 start_codon:yes stop_codon:yes gene_type:complete
MGRERRQRRRVRFHVDISCYEEERFFIDPVAKMCIDDKPALNAYIKRAIIFYQSAIVAAQSGLVEGVSSELKEELDSAVGVNPDGGMRSSSNANSIRNEVSQNSHPSASNEEVIETSPELLSMLALDDDDEIP